MPKIPEQVIPEDIDDADSSRILSKAAEEIVKRRLTAPALVMLEISAPLSFVASQAMIGLEPLVHAIFDLPDYRKFSLLIERRKNVQKLITMIETANEEQKLAQAKTERKRVTNRLGKWLGRR